MKEVLIKDELVAHVSDECGEAIKKLIEADKPEKPKPKFEPINFDRLSIWVNEESLGNCPIHIRCGIYDSTKEGACYDIGEVERIISALQQAKAFVKANK